MKRKALLACLSCLFSLGLSGVACGADDAATEPAAAGGQADDRELLFLVEEQDLVSATKRPITLRKAPAIATIITADEIRNMGANTLLDVLKMVPGFGISINEFNSTMVEVRGIRTPISEKILVMIDGHSLNRNTNGSALYRIISVMPMENVKQVEVVRGPGSALYGNSAFVATINIITRNAVEINGLEVKGGGGNFDTYKGNLVGGAAIGDKLTVSGSLDHFRSHGPNSRIEADALTGTPFSKAPGPADESVRQSEAFLKVGYGDLSFRGQYITQRQGLNVGIVSALTDDSSKSIFDNYWGELAYSLRLNQDISTTFKASYDFYSQDPYVKIYPNGFLGLFPDGFVGKPMLKDRTFTGEMQLDWDLFRGNHLISGLSFEAMEQYDVKQLGNFNPATGAPVGSIQEIANWNKDAKRQIFAAYGQDEWQLPARVNLTAGVRYDHYSDFGDTVNPRVGLVWSFLDNADLKLLYGEAFRAPNFNELNNINNPVVVGNPHLKPERIQTYEAGLAWRFNRYFAANMNYFYSSISDLIVWVPSTTPGQPAVNTNVGNAVTQGVELEANGALSTKLHYKLCYAYQDPRDADTGGRLPYVPRQRASGSINYALNKFVNLHTDILWTGARPRTAADTRPEIPAYSTVDLSVTLKNFFKTLELQGTVKNLLDEKYSDPDTSAGAANLAQTGPKVPGDFPRPGISGLVTAKYRF